MLIISDSYLQYRTFALYRAQHPSSPTQGAAPLGRLPLGYGLYPFQGIYASHHADGLKAQGVHSPGQGERSEATPWVGIHPHGAPYEGKSKNTLLVISDSYLQYRTFALTGRNTPHHHPRRRSQSRLPLGYGLYPFQGIYASHHADGLKAQGVHSPGQGERSEATPWVGIHPHGAPYEGKSKNTLLVISDSYLQYRTFALTGRNTPHHPPKAPLPLVACRWAMDSLPLRGAPPTVYHIPLSVVR